MKQLHSQWDKPLELKDSLEFLRSQALPFARKGGRVGLEIHALLMRRAWHELVHYEIEVNAPGWDPSQLLACRQAQAFFNKLEDLDIGIDREKEAFDKFWATEARCKETNQSIAACFKGGDLAVVGSSRAPVKASAVPQFARLIGRMQKKIRWVAGRCPPVGELALAFGPGATTSTKKKDACPQSKMAAGLACSYNLFYKGNYLADLLGQIPEWTSALDTRWGITKGPVVGSFDEGCDLSTFNVLVDPVLRANDQVELGWLVEVMDVTLSPARLGCVPKNAKSFRTTLTEPVLNGVLQKGIGRHLEKKLRVVGLDIKDQTRNQRLAREGSITNALATLDLRSASDLICSQLVKLLFEPDWFNLLDAARSSVVYHEGEQIALEKFSSMGNGFTFPLQTLIFWACASATLDEACEGLHGEELVLEPEETRTISAYGDDLVVPSRIAPLVMQHLKLLGFEVNTEKSFVSGPFRESCGKDYYNGIDVRPFYQKHLVSAETAFILHNYYYRRYHFDEAETVKSQIPRDLRIYGPDGYGDGHLLGSFWPQLREKGWSEKGYSGYSFETFSRTPVHKKNLFPGDYVSPLYHIYTTGCDDDIDSDKCPKPWLWNYQPRDLFRQLGASPLLPLAQLSGGFRGASSRIKFDKANRPQWSVPGSQGYRRTKIYVLA